MAVTKKGFTGAPFPDPGASTETLLQTVTGAGAMQSAAAKGLGSSQDPPGGMATPPRSTYSAMPGQDVVQAGGNSASTGHQGVGIPIVGGGASGDQHNSLQTGAGQGSKTVKRYGGTTGAPATLTGGEGGALGRNTAK